MSEKSGRIFTATGLTGYVAWSSFPDLEIDRAKVRAFDFRP